jgi:hypothetical protein
MFEYRSKHISSRTSRPSSVAFRGAAPATPRKAPALKESSLSPSFLFNLEFASALDQLYGQANTSPSKGTVQEEFDRYVSGSSPRETDIIRFWEVSFAYTIRDERSQ